MRLLFIILSILLAILGLILSILPFGTIALIPIIAAFLFGVLAIKMSKNKNTNLIKITFLVTIIALCISIYRSFEENVVENDVETIEKEKQSEEDAIEELEAIEIEE